jgi:putative transposon-encoded protein
MEKVKVYMKFNDKNIIVMKEVKPSGTAGHIILPRRFLGKTAMVIISQGQKII